MEKPTRRAVVIDDDPIARAFLRGVLEVAEVAFVGEAARAQEGLELVVSEAPDVALVDLGLPDLSGIELIRRLRHLAPAVEVMVVTASEDQNDLVDSIAAGARGYVMKGAAEEELADAVLRVAESECVLSRRTIGRLVDFVRHRPVIAAEDAARASEVLRATLTEREVRILEFLAMGKENAAIAKELNLSSHTVKNHVRNILTKLHLENRVQAAVQAVRSGIA